MSGWVNTDVVTLIDLYARGLDYSSIATALNKNRSAVRHKAQRLKLPETFDPDVHKPLSVQAISVFVYLLDFKNLPCPTNQDIDENAGGSSAMVRTLKSAKWIDVEKGDGWSRRIRFLVSEGQTDWSHQSQVIRADYIGDRNDAEIERLLRLDWAYEAIGARLGMCARAVQDRVHEAQLRPEPTIPQGLTPTYTVDTTVHHDIASFDLSGRDESEREQIERFVREQGVKRSVVKWAGQENSDGV